MNKSTIEAGQPEQVTVNEQKADSQHVSPSNANAPVSGCTGGDFDRLKDYLEYHFEIFPDEGEMEDIIDLAVKQDGFLANKVVS